MAQVLLVVDKASRRVITIHHHEPNFAWVRSHHSNENQEIVEGDFNIDFGKAYAYEDGSLRECNDGLIRKVYVT